MSDAKKPIPGHEQIPDYRKLPTYNPKLDHGAGEIGLGKSSKYRRTSTPSLEELNKPDFPPGVDPLPLPRDPDPDLL